MTQLALYNEYVARVVQLAAQITLAEAVWAADPDAENPSYDQSVDMALLIYDALNEVHSSLELFVESIPEGSLESSALRTKQTEQYDIAADRIMRWQRQIQQVMFKLRAYADADMEPHQAAPLIQALRDLPQRPPA